MCPIGQRFFFQDIQNHGTDLKNAPRLFSHSTYAQSALVCPWKVKMRHFSDRMTNGFVDTWAADVPAMNMCDRYIEMRGNDGCSKRLIAISEDQHAIRSFIHAMIADPSDLL